MGTDTMKLSHVLLDIGFFATLGTSERYIAHTADENSRCVKRGVPNTWDYNNGVLVVYDELGRPWILHHSQGAEEAKEKLRDFYPLKRGAHVPHSNDGGNFVRNVVLKF
jgi:hypothetical protein